MIILKSCDDSTAIQAVELMPSREDEGGESLFTFGTVPMAHENRRWSDLGVLHNHFRITKGRDSSRCFCNWAMEGTKRHQEN